MIESTLPLKNKVPNLLIYFICICCYLTWFNYFTANNGQIPIEIKSQTIAGILGVVKLLIGPYIIVIKKKEFVGKLDGHDIWKLIDIDILPIPKTRLHINEIQVYNIHIFLYQKLYFYIFIFNRTEWILNI